MKKILNLLVCLLLVPILTVNAENYEDKFNFNVGDNITEEKSINGSSIVAGNNVTVTNDTKGIDMSFGNNVNYQSNSDYALIAGNIVNINGFVRNDGFIFGNIITFDKNTTVSRDLFIFGTDVILRGNITRDVTIMASSVTIEDAVVENIKIEASSITVKNAVITKDFSYNKDATLDISNEALINNKIELDSQVYETSLTDQVWNFLIDYSGILLVFLVSALLVPNLYNKIEKQTEEISTFKLFSMLGYGAFALIVIPILFVILLMTGIGVYLGLLLLGLYITAIFLSIIFAGYLLGLIIFKKLLKKEINILLVGLLGITILKVLSIIPYLNTLSVIFSILVGINLVINLFKKEN